MATDICLTISKFSHATGLRADKTIPWTHITAENLFVTIVGEATDVPSGKMSLRVFQGTTVLESVNIGECVDQALFVRSTAMRNGNPLSLENLPIFGLTKDTAIAIRHRLSDSTPRRIQLRMHSINDCCQVVSTLRQRGLEFQEQRPSTTRSILSQVPPTSKGYRPQTSASQTAFERRENRNVLSSSNSIDQPVAVPGVFYQEPYSQTITRPVDYIRNATPSIAPPLQLSRDISIAPRNPFPNLPLGNRKEPQQSSTNHTNTAVPVSTECAVDYHGRRHDGNMLTGNLSVVQNAAVYQSPSTGIPAKTPAFVSSDAVLSRPWTSASLTSAPTRFSQFLDHDLPPRRELPFKRSDSRRTEDDQSSSRPSSSVMSRPPLRKPTLAKGTVAPTSSVPSVIEPGYSIGTNRDLAAEPTLPVPTGLTIERPISSNVVRYEIERVPERVPSTMAHRTASAGRRDHSSSNNHLPVLPLEPAQTNNDPNQSLPESESLKKTHAALLNSFHRMDSASLDSFAKLSGEERHAALNNFIIEKLQDPNFVSLCEDVENCWRRIGFG